MKAPSALRNGKSNSIPVAQEPLRKNICGVVARLRSTDGEVMYGDVLVLTNRDIVVSISTTAKSPKLGDPISICLMSDDKDAKTYVREGIVHWQQTIGKERVSALFLSSGAPGELLNKTLDDRRGNVRFTSSLSVAFQLDGKSVSGRLTNYSINGLAAHCTEPLEIGKTYSIRVDSRGGHSEAHATCRWHIETPYGHISGCSLRPDEGMVLAARAVDQIVIPWELTHTSDDETLTGRISPAGRALKNQITRHNASMETVRNDGTVDNISARIAVLALSLALILLSLSMLSSTSGVIGFLAGCTGLIASIYAYAAAWRSEHNSKARAEAMLGRLKQRIGEPPESSPSNPGSA